MSVPKSERTKKLNICYLADQIEVKVVKMTMNEKYYPKRARYIITNKIVDSAMSVSSNFTAANTIFPNSERKLEMRQEYQIIGKANLAILEHQLNLSKQLFNIPGTVLEEVFAMITDINKMYPNWLKADKNTMGRELEKARKRLEEKENKTKEKDSE